jgi:hypothetical protein
VSLNALNSTVISDSIKKEGESPFKLLVEEEEPLTIVEPEERTGRLPNWYYDLFYEYEMQFLIAGGVVLFLFLLCSAACCTWRHQKAKKRREFELLYKDLEQDQSLEPLVEF